MQANVKLLVARSVLCVAALGWSVAPLLPVWAAVPCSPKDVWQVNDCTGITCCDVGYVCRAQDYKNGREGTLSQHICEVAPPAEQEGSSSATTPLEFQPQVTIPGTITVGGQQVSFRQGQGLAVTGDTIAQYLGVFYKFFIAMLAVAAVVMVMWGGFKRIMAVGSPEKIADANDAIVSALTGLVLVLISYSLLNLINPKLTSFKTLALTPVTRIEFEDVEAEQIVAAATQPSSVPQVAIISGANISNPGNKIATLPLITALQAAAAELAKQNVYVIVTSGTRTVAEQTALILKNCINPPGSTSCHPKPGGVETCPLPGNNPLSCPHTSGQAVDVWAAQGNSTPISQKACQANKPACEQDPAMAALIAAMRAQGFCKLDSEPWHFEQPVVSAGRCH